MNVFRDRSRDLGLVERDVHITPGFLAPVIKGFLRATPLSGRSGLRSSIDLLLVKDGKGAEDRHGDEPSLPNANPTPPSSVLTGSGGIINELLDLEHRTRPKSRASEEGTTGYFFEADPAATRYFDVSRHGSVEPLLRELSITTDATHLGLSFQGPNGVRVLSLNDQLRLSRYTAGLTLDRRLSRLSVAPLST